MVGESDTESINGGASSASAIEEVPDVPKLSMTFEDVRVKSREIRDAFAALDAVDEVVFSRRAIVMKTVPHFLRGAFRSAIRIAMEEATQHKRVDTNVVGNSSCFFPERCCTDDRGKGTSRRTNWSAGSTISRRVVGMC